MTSGGKLPFRLVLAGAALLIGAAVQAQNAGSSGLVVQVNPEAHLSPSAATLGFQVTNPGDTVASQPVTVTAWVRSLPNQQIQLTARPVSLTGPSGSVALSALHWNGSVMQATGGGTAAALHQRRFQQRPVGAVDRFMDTIRYRDLQRHVFARDRGLLARRQLHGANRPLIVRAMSPV